MIKLKNILLENPDTVYIPKEHLNLWYGDQSNKTFAFAYNKKNGKWSCGYMHMGHSEIGIPFDEREYEGRVFSVHRIITFWIFPGISQFKSAIAAINKQQKLSINNKWRLEVYYESETSGKPVAELITLADFFNKDFKHNLRVSGANIDDGIYNFKPRKTKK